MTLTNLYLAPVPFLRQLCTAFERAAIEDDGVTKMARSGSGSNRLLRSFFD